MALLGVFGVTAQGIKNLVCAHTTTVLKDETPNVHGINRDLDKINLDGLKSFLGTDHFCRVADRFSSSSPLRLCVNFRLFGPKALPNTSNLWIPREIRLLEDLQSPGGRCAVGLPYPKESVPR